MSICGRSDGKYLDVTRQMKRFLNAVGEMRLWGPSLWLLGWEPHA